MCTYVYCIILLALPRVTVVMVVVMGFEIDFTGNLESIKPWDFT